MCLIIINMAKTYIFLLAIIILAHSRKVINKQSPFQQKELLAALRQNHPILFEVSQPKIIQHFVEESKVPKIFEYSQVQAIYPHFKVPHQEGKIQQKLASYTNISKRLAKKQSVIQQTPIQHVQQKIQKKVVKIIEKDDTAIGINTKRSKQLKQAEQVVTSGPSSLGLRKENSKNREEEPSNSIFDSIHFVQGFKPSRNLLIVLLVLFLLGLLLLLKCCRDSSDYQRLDLNDHQSSFAS